MKKRELGVAFYNLSGLPRAPRTGIESPVGADMATIMKHLFKAFRSTSDPLRPSIEHGATLLELADMGHDEAMGEYHLLVNFSDSDTADFLFKNNTTRRSRSSTKQEDDGIDRSTHILLKVLNPRQARLLVTARTGVGAYRLAQLFGRAVNMLDQRSTSAHLFVQPHPNAVPGETYRVNYKFECQGYMGSTLQEALDGGKLNGVELIRYERDAEFDDDGELLKKSTSIQLRPTDATGITLGRLQRAVRRVIPDGYSKAVIAFSDHEGEQRSKTFDIDALEEAFVRKEVMKFDTDLVQSYARISPAIIAKMREHL